MHDKHNLKLQRLKKLQRFKSKKGFKTASSYLCVILHSNVQWFLTILKNKQGTTFNARKSFSFRITNFICIVFNLLLIYLDFLILTIIYIVFN